MRLEAAFFYCLTTFPKDVIKPFFKLGFYDRMINLLFATAAGENNLAAAVSINWLTSMQYISKDPYTWLRATDAFYFAKSR